MKQHVALRTGVFAIGFLGVLSSLPASSAHPSTPQYTFTNLGTPSRRAFNLHGFNDSGQIVGEAIPDGGSAFRGFVWQAGKVTWLPSLGGSVVSAQPLTTRARLWELPKVPSIQAQTQWKP